MQYDVLPRESEILHLKFWDAAFQQLKNARSHSPGDFGEKCRMLGDEPRGQRSAGENGAEDGGAEGDSAETDDTAKVIVRSNGTVTYVGKDIAYQLWKFGLLGRDFDTGDFYRYPNGHTLWTSTADDGEPGAPEFGHADRSCTTSSTRGKRICKTSLWPGCARWDLRNRPRVRSIFPTTWWRFRRAAPRRWATRSRKKRCASLTWR